MNKVMDILKVSNYDEFRCIADKCMFTCCDGWDVSIDANTYNKWKQKSDKSDYILSNVKMKKCGSERLYFINKETKEPCPFLDKGGLCYIVKSHGEEYLSSTCHMFPRIENIFEDKKELSLSCACPEVVELISRITGKINMTSENETKLKNHLLELKTREVLVNIMQQEKISLDHKLIISFQMLLTIMENEEFEKDTLMEELDNYESIEYMQGLIDMYEEVELTLEDSAIEINNLFLDIIQDYKEVSILETLLKDIYDFAEDVEIEMLSSKWQVYKSLFEGHNQLVENCIVSKVLGSCVSSDMEELTIAFQMIALEYLLVRHAVFLKYVMNESEEIESSDIKDYIVAFSRIIGNNTEAVIEFLKDGFGEEILEIEYLCFITLF
ncbi:MAG: flagellin lysine-N-methylase [Clostridium sp.]|uniref:flagellin lysine-N-methylase n=1 Tax=Clostridium sp. TaxID=1506 RepID=UPI003062487C